MSPTDAPSPDVVVAHVDEVAAPTAECWRCRLATPFESGRCVHCGAALNQRAARAQRAELTGPSQALRVLMWSYGFVLLTGIAHGIVLEARFGDVEEITAEIAFQAEIQIAVVEAIDTLIVALAFAAMPRRPAAARDRISFAAWVWAGPALVGLLAINFAYHALLRHVLHVPLIESDIREAGSWWALATVCLQPAIVEEAYCRGLALGVLRGVTGPHAAVWLVAGMFALMHVSAMLSLPYLFLVGVALGYMRLASGTLWLPVVAHFLHNFAVLVKEWN